MGLAFPLGIGRGPDQGGVVVSSEGKARFGLLGLLVFTTLSFAQVFAAGDYPGPMLLAIGCASGLAVAARRLGAGTGTTVLVSLGSLLLYLVLIFQARNSFFLLPSPDAIAGLARSVETALRHSSVDFAPVPVRTGYVVLVVIGIWVATTIGEIATFRWRRPLLAALPPVGLFTLQMTVGTGNGAPILVVAFVVTLLTFWGFESAHRLRSWGRWVPTWEGRAGTEPEAVTGSLARRMGIGCVAAAVVAPMIVPALGDGLLVWRNDIGAGAFGGAGGSGRVNPLVSIAPRFIERNSDPLFTVEAESSSYWRLLSLAEFDGRDWEPIEDEGAFVITNGQQFGELQNPTLDTVEVVQRFVFQDLLTEKLPAAINPGLLDLESDTPVRYSTVNGDLTVDEELGEGFAYTVTSSVPDLTFENLGEADVGFAEHPAYLQLPEGITGRVRDLADRLATDPQTGEDLPPGEFLLRVQDHLRSFLYRDDAEFVEQVAVEGASVGYLDHFLFDNRQGYCQQFATAFALLARLRDIPTRVAVGFLPGDRDVSEDTFVVSDTDTHAWPEVFLEDYGWVRFEPTPRAAAREPSYARPPVLPGQGLPDVGGTENGLGTVGALERQDRRLAGAQVGADLGDRNRIIGGEFGGPGGLAENPVWTRTFNRLVLIVSAGLLLFLASVPFMKRLRITRRYRRATGANETAAAAFLHFQDEAAELAAPRVRAESAAAFAARMGAARAVPAADASRLAAIYEAAEYGPRGIGADQAGQAKRLAQKLRSVMWKRASWWARATRLFSPKGLVGRP